jgi:hypothetical protein
MRLKLILLLLLASPAAAPAQELEAYHFVSAALGWGAVRPVGDTGVEGAAADAGRGLYLAFAMEGRRTRSGFLYGRLEADAADVRQHIGITGGGRLVLRPGERLRPFGGAGAGLMWVEPRTTLTHVIEREVVPRAEGFAGAEWSLLPALRLFGEFRLGGARFHAITLRPGCSGSQTECLETSPEQVLHLSRTLWFGGRIAL